MCEEQNSPAEGTCRPANASLLCLPVDECFLFSDGLYFVATLTLAECHRASSVQYWLCTCWPCSSSSSSGTHTGSIHPLLVLWIYRVCVCVCVQEKYCKCPQEGQGKEAHPLQFRTGLQFRPCSQRKQSMCACLWSHCLPIQMCACDSISINRKSTPAE